MKFLIPSLVITATLLSLNPAYAKDRFNYRDAASEDGTDAVYFLGGSIGSGTATTAVDNLTTKTLLDRSAKPAPLNNTQIEKIMDKVNGYSNLSVGDVGGIEVQITYDAKQSETMSAMENLSKKVEAIPADQIKEAAAKLQETPKANAGVIGDVRTGVIQTQAIDNMAVVDKALATSVNHKPEFVTKILNLRTGTDVLKEQLEDLAKQGASIQSIRIQNMPGRVLSKTLGSVAVISGGMSAERAAVGAWTFISGGPSGADYAYCGRAICEKPSYVKRLITGAAQPAYQREIQVYGADRVESAQ